jgi:chromosome partitioning protein
MRLAFVSGKGGTGKTTSTVYIAMALHRLGRTLAVDCDPQGSLLSWSRALPFTTVSLPVNDVHRRLPALADGFDHVVIDSPPGDTGIIRSVILSVPLVVVPVSATGLDIDRLGPTWETLRDLEDSHPLGLAVGVLLTRVRSGTRSRTEARTELSALGYPILDTEIPLREAYADSFGQAPEDLAAYEDLLTELKQ